jgi:chaperonin GroEL
MGQKFYTEHVQGEEATRRLLHASHKINSAIEKTLGPIAGNAVLERQNGMVTPTVTKDGATVMYDLKFADKWETMVYELYRDATDHISKTIGDGTTSVIQYTHALLKEAVKAHTLEYNPANVNRGMRQALQHTLEYVNKYAVFPNATEKVIRAVLNVSSASDKKMVDLLTDVFMENSENGMIIVKDSTLGEDQCTIEDGYVIGIGTKNGELFSLDQDKPKAHVSWNNPYVLIVEEPLNSFKQITGILEQIVLKGESKKLLLVYSSIEESVIESIRKNNLSDKNPLEIMTVRMPMYAERQVRLLEDIAAYTDAVIGSKEKFTPTDSFSLRDLGRADNLSATMYEVKLVGGRGAHKIEKNGKSRLANRIWEVEQDRDNFTGNLEERKDGNYRLARLCGEIICVYPGGRSEEEAKKRKGVLEDCIRATQEAIHNGVVAGAGWVPYMIAQTYLPTTKQLDNAEEAYGYYCFMKAAKSVFTKISRDADHPPEYIQGLIQQYALDNKIDPIKVTYNFITKTVGEATDINVLEPVNLIAETLTYAVSLVSTMLTASGTVTKHPTKTGHKTWKEKIQAMEHLYY